MLKIVYKKYPIFGISNPYEIIYLTQNLNLL